MYSAVHVIHFLVNIASRCDVCFDLTTIRIATDSTYNSIIILKMEGGWAQSGLLLWCVLHTRKLHDLKIVNVSLGAATGALPCNHASQDKLLSTCPTSRATLIPPAGGNKK